MSGVTRRAWSAAEQGHRTAGRSNRRRGQSLVEFALIVPVLLLIVLGALDFGRLMQARITSESAMRAGASWGASNIGNAIQPLAPDYGANACGTSYSPTCNIEARACAEAAGLPGYNGGSVLTGGGQYKYQACSSGVATGVCQAGPKQSNPFLSVTWLHADGSTFNPQNTTPQPGDSIEVSGSFCFQTFFPFPQILHQVSWTSTSTYVIQQ